MIGTKTQAGRVLRPRLAQEVVCTIRRATPSSPVSCSPGDEGAAEGSGRAHGEYLREGLDLLMQQIDCLSKDRIRIATLRVDCAAIMARLGELKAAAHHHDFKDRLIYVAKELLDADTFQNLVAAAQDQPRIVLDDHED